MNSKHVIPIQAESFVLLVRQLKKRIDLADIFEIHLDQMRVKGDLAVIQNFFKKPMIAKSTNLDLLKKGVKSGMHYVDVPHDMDVDLEFTTMVKNKGAKVIRSYHNYDRTPESRVLLEIINNMANLGADYFKVSSHIADTHDVATLLSLLEKSEHKTRLSVTAYGDEGHDLRIKAAAHGSVFYYAPLAH